MLLLGVVTHLLDAQKQKLTTPTKPIRVFISIDIRTMMIVFLRSLFIVYSKIASTSSEPESKSTVYSTSC